MKKHKDLFNYEWILEMNDFSRKYLTASSDIQDGFVEFAFFFLRGNGVSMRCREIVKDIDF